MSANEKLLVDSQGTPMDRIVGFETEYGFMAQLQDGRYVAPDDGEKLYKFVKNNGHQHGENGNRNYVDHGVHPEISTAEDTDFVDAAHRVSAGHEELSGKFDQPELLAMRNWKGVRLAANTVDGRGQASWASHENYLTKRALKPDDFINPLAVYRASRIIWSGAGHVRTGRSGSDFEFALSEKAEFIEEVSGEETTDKRPLVNLRDRPYTGNQNTYRRIHDVSGETVFSPFVNAMRLASTSIVLRACELGVDFSDLELENPVVATKQISHDPSLKQKVRLVNARTLTAIDLQKEIASRSINKAGDADYLTDQEKVWGQKWLELLEALSRDPLDYDHQLDWVVKQHMIETALEKNETQTPRAVAQALALKYHYILPAPGLGMRLLRKGYFENSPSPEVLQNGPGLPETRAKIRGSAIAFVYTHGLWHMTNWSSTVISSQEDSKRFDIDDPYQTELPELDEFLTKLAA